MLESNITKKIEDFVYQKPRSVHEIAKYIGKNWRTVDRYVAEIEKNFGTISARTFREGTRGALKIVFWSSVEKISGSIFQERLEEEISKARKKEDFSAFDIFQHVAGDKKKALITNERDMAGDLAEFLKSVEKQVLIFSGNLSFINFADKKFNMMKILDDLVKKNISIKILCRIDLAGRENVEKILSLNFKNGKELIEIRHREHPLRAMIFDKKFFQIREIKEPTGKINELEKKNFYLVYYQ